MHEYERLIQKKGRVLEITEQFLQTREKAYACSKLDIQKVVLRTNLTTNTFHLHDTYTRKVGSSRRHILD